MNPLLVGPLFEVGKTLIDRFFPDPEKKREAEAKFLDMAMQGELKQVIAQLEINAREAAHPTIWVAGWRPFVGWVGGLGLFYATIGQPSADLGRHDQGLACAARAGHGSAVGRAVRDAGHRRPADLREVEGSGVEMSVDWSRYPNFLSGGVHLPLRLRPQRDEARVPRTAPGASQRVR
jgi:hypothetical protein